MAWYFQVLLAHAATRKLTLIKFVSGYKNAYSLLKCSHSLN